MTSDGADDFLESGGGEVEGDGAEEPVGLIAEALAALEDLEDRMDKLVDDTAYISDVVFELGLTLQEIAADPRLRAPEA